MQITFYLVALFCLAQSANLVKLSAAAPDVLGFWRLLGASVILLVWGFWKHDLAKLLRNPPQHLFFVLLTAVLFYGHLWTYTYAAQNTTIANSMIIFATNPLFTSLGAFLIFREKLSARIGFAYLVAFIGIFQLLNHSWKWDPLDFRGDISALLSAVLFAGYLLSAKKSRMVFSNTIYSGIMYFITALIFGVSGLFNHVDFIHNTTTTWFSILGLILLPTFLGHSLISYLMKTMNLNLMTCGKLIEPVISTLTAFFLFHELPTVHTYWAFALTSASIVILFFPFLRQTPQKHA